MRFRASAEDPGGPGKSLAVDFDDFALTYQSLLDENLKISGESAQYFSAYKANYLARCLGRQAGRKILDYGCGVGLLSVELKRRLPGAQVHGYDLSQDSVARVPAALSAQGRFTSDWDAVGDDFDVAVIANVLHHIPVTERQETIRKIARRLSPAGYLVIFEHNPANPLTRRAVAQCPFDGDAVLLPPRESVEYARGAGMVFMKRDFLVFFPRRLRWFRSLEPRLAWCGLGAQYAVTAMKPAVAKMVVAPVRANELRIAE